MDHIVPEKMKLSGVILQEILTFDLRGFVVRKDYYFNYKNANQQGTLVYSKENNYSFDNETLYIGH